MKCCGLSFANRKGKAFQYSLNETDWQLQSVDGSKYNDDPSGLKDYVQELINGPFDLSKDYMLRARNDLYK
jgi:hypothetical protein